MCDENAAGDETKVRSPARRRVVLRIAMPLAVIVSLLSLHVFLVAPFRQTLWIILRADQPGLSVKTEPGGPDWLRHALGDHWTRGFDDITRLGLDADDKIDTARLLRYLKPHPGVESLTLCSPIACDDHFGRLDCLPNLKTLRLEEGILTDEGMQHLRRCESLATLHLTELRITDAGLEPIGSLSGLEELQITECPGLTDEGIRHLAHATRVQELGLSGQGITDASVSTLAGMKRLRMLDVTGTGMTTDGAMRLADSLPQCTIVWSEDGSVFSNRIANGLGN